MSEILEWKRKEPFYATILVCFPAWVDANVPPKSIALAPSTSPLLRRTLRALHSVTLICRPL